MVFAPSVSSQPIGLAQVSQRGVEEVQVDGRNLVTSVPPAGGCRFVAGSFTRLLIGCGLTTPTTSGVGG